MKHLALTGLLLLGALGNFANGQTQYTAYLLSQTNFAFAQARGISFGQQVGTGFTNVSGQNMERAILWSGSFSNAITLHPPGFSSSAASGVSDNEQVGDGGYPAQQGVTSHALLWRGNAESVVDLHPAGFDASSAWAVHGGVQVGAGWTSNHAHALLWRGSPTNFVDLHPRLPGYLDTVAAGVSGAIQGGYVIQSLVPDSIRAVMWRGMPESMVDLHPPSKLGPDYIRPYIQTEVTGVSCHDLVGNGFVRTPAGNLGNAHALLWHGSATNYVDLNPAGFSWSYGRGISGNKQVGYGGATNEAFAQVRALVWTGTPDSVVDLHQFLPAVSPAFQYSVATGIDEFGNIIGFAGFVSNPGPFQVNNDQAVLWIPDFGNGDIPLLTIAPWCLAGGQIKIQLQGEAGRTYAVEKSLDLLSWGGFLQTNIPNPVFYFRDSPTTGVQHGFYRASIINQP